ncbi:cathepsin L1-like [Belonocnema kinseyi]|uniref:cathepsin L1-like n=1 Tax=Belonocnema kinseyi TaxID=2817044 RepID=UPI00143CDABC|nr:cathepsin L1-like [Belonocnema kinseyi]
MKQWKCIVIWCHLAMLMISVEEILATWYLPPELSKFFDDYWDVYKSSFNKSYDPTHERLRRAAWEENLLTVYDHNLLAAKGHHDYLLRDNHIADLSTQMYLRDMVKLLPSRREGSEDDQMLSAAPRQSSKIPKYLDWRECGFMTPPRNQRDCGSCYAYSIAGTIEGQLFKHNGKLITLSEQQLVDCSSTTGNLGCTGGSLKNTLRYLDRSKGIMSGASYPYVAKEGTCKYKSSQSVAKVKSWAILPARDERALETAVATIGPIAVSINASPKTFQLYHTGIYDDPACVSSTVNHAMLLVGYSPKYWILKNWWGNTWGENGYMRLAKNKNRCGVANYAAYTRI